ncbi:MAG: TolC family protein [Planctomycetota bacterium]
MKWFESGAGSFGPGFRLVAWFGVAVFAMTVSCKTPEEHLAEADKESYAIIGEARKVAGQAADPAFTIDSMGPRLRDGLLFPRPDDSQPGPAERLARGGKSVKVDLETALLIATRNSREFQDEKERLYGSALSLTGNWNNFSSQYFGTVEVGADANGDGLNDTTPSLQENGSLGFTRLIESGGSYSLNIGEDFTRFLTNPAGSVAGSLLNFTLSLPILRGAGREIAYENVIQSERDVVYAVRDFERFKRTYGVRVVSNYLQLLRSWQRVENEKSNLKRRELTAVENRALGEAGRIAITDVERVNQSVLSAETRLISAQQQFESALDQFKLTLGLPVDARLEIDPIDLKRLREAGTENLQFSQGDATKYGLKNRLDLATTDARVQDARRTVVVAIDALRAGLDFQATAGLRSNDFAEETFKIDLLGDGNYSISALLDLPFERVDERNAYRNSLINYDQSRRNAEEFEDQVKLQVRAALRNLRQAVEDNRIQGAAVKVAETNVDAANLLKAAGEGTTIDLVDAQNDLIDAQNAVTDALIDYRIARLELMRDMGVLTIGPQGIDEETTRRLLKLEE